MNDHDGHNLPLDYHQHSLTLYECFALNGNIVAVCIVVKYLNKGLTRSLSQLSSH